MRSILYKLFITICLLSLSITVFAQSNQVKSPITITADSVKYFGAAKRTEFSGNVVGISDNYTITSDEVTVLMTDNSIIKKIIGVGNVNIKTDSIIAISEKGVVDEQRKVATLSGGVKVWQDENFLEGDTVVIYYLDDRIEVEKGEQKRVTIIFKPEEEGE